MAKVADDFEFPHPSSKANTKSSINDMMKPNINYAKPLYYISLVTALTCPINMNKYCARSGKGHKIYGCLTIALILAANVFSFRGRMKTSYTFFIQTVTIGDMFQQAILFIINVYSIGNVLFNGECYIQRYFNSMKQIDKKLSTTMNLQRKSIYFYSQLFFSHLLLILLCIYDFWIWSTSLGIHVWQFYSFRLYSFYLTLVIVIQIFTFARALKVRFEMLNERLFDVSLDWLGNVESSEALTVRDLFLSYKKNSQKAQPSGISLQCLIKMHDLLCDMIELLNNAYGFNVVLLVCATIVNSVIAFNLALIFSTGLQQSSGNSMVHLISLNVLWALYYIAMGITMATSCDTSSKEAWRAATIAYKLLSCVPIDSQNKKDQETRVLLNQLASQIAHRRPVFDACGFFPINNSMLYAIIGAISSYIVIIIQFNNSPIMSNNIKFNNTGTLNSLKL